MLGLPHRRDKELSGPDVRSRPTTTRSRWRSAPTFLRSRGTSMIIANIEDYRKQCEARLPRFLYDYISGGSFQENSLRANIAEGMLRRAGVGLCIGGGWPI